MPTEPASATPDWVPPWPPILIGDAEWIIMRHSNREPVAVVRAVKIGPRDEKYFRVVTWAQASEDRTLVGYFSSLAEADRSVRFDNTIPTRGAPNGK